MCVCVHACVSVYMCAYEYVRVCVLVYVRGCVRVCLCVGECGELAQVRSRERAPPTQQRSGPSPPFSSCSDPAFRGWGEGTAPCRQGGPSRERGGLPWRQSGRTAQAQKTHRPIRAHHVAAYAGIMRERGCEGRARVPIRKCIRALSRGAPVLVGLKTKAPRASLRFAPD